jgi:hypothetical protein
MDYHEFLEDVKADRLAQAERSRLRQKEIDDVWDAISDHFDTVGVPHRISRGQAIND